MAYHIIQMIIRFLLFYMVLGQKLDVTLASIKPGRRRFWGAKPIFLAKSLMMQFSTSHSSGWDNTPVFQLGFNSYFSQFSLMMTIPVSCNEGSRMYSLSILPTRRKWSDWLMQRRGSPSSLRFRFTSPQHFLTFSGIHTQPSTWNSTRQTRPNTFNTFTKGFPTIKKFTTLRLRYVAIGITKNWWWEYNSLVPIILR